MKLNQIVAQIFLKWPGFFKTVQFETGYQTFTDLTFTDRTFGEMTFTARLLVFKTFGDPDFC